MRSILSILVVGLSFLACDPGVEPIKLPTSGLYAVSCFISPQDTAHVVWLYRAAMLGEVANSENLVVRDALVVISDQFGSDTLEIEEGKEHYYGPHEHVTIEALTTYNLSISIPGQTIILATCTVPATPIAPEINGSRIDEDYEFTMSWSNPIGHVYYVASVTAHGFWPILTPRGDSSKVLLYADLEQRQYPTKPQPITGSVNGVILRAFRAKEPGLTARIWNVDEHYYEYFRTLDNYDAWIVSANEPIPLFNQPTSIYSNVQGAIGIFASFNVSATHVEIK